jgi:hypothetical protein
MLQRHFLLSACQVVVLEVVEMVEIRVAPLYLHTEHFSIENLKKSFQNFLVIVWRKSFFGKKNLWKKNQRSRLLTLNPIAKRHGTKQQKPGVRLRGWPCAAWPADRAKASHSLAP